MRNHIVQSTLYALNLGLGYIVMLISMDYYSGHFLAIVLGEFFFASLFLFVEIFFYIPKPSFIGYAFAYYFLHYSSPNFDESVRVDAANGNHLQNPNYKRENYESI